MSTYGNPRSSKYPSTIVRDYQSSINHGDVAPGSELPNYTMLESSQFSPSIGNVENLANQSSSSGNSHYHFVDKAQSKSKRDLSLTTNSEAQPFDQFRNPNHMRLQSKESTQSQSSFGFGKYY